MLFDTHTHLDQDEFDDTRDAVLSRAREAGVERIMVVGCTLEASRKCLRLAQEQPGLYAVVGIQPNYVAEAGPEDWEAIEQLATHDEAVAVGETGLDRHWDFTPFDQQQDYFDRHLRLAQRLDLPVIIHMRDCDAEIMEALRSASARGALRGIMHSFTGSAEMAAECVALGLHISFAGMLTFKKSGALRECAASIPADRLLIETDSPYLSPEPVRGKKPNEPAFLRHTAECLAKVRRMTLAELASLTTQNARQLFRVD